MGILQVISPKIDRTAAPLIKLRQLIQMFQASHDSKSVDNSQSSLAVFPFSQDQHQKLLPLIQPSPHINPSTSSVNALTLNFSVIPDMAGTHSCSTSTSIGKFTWLIDTEPLIMLSAPLTCSLPINQSATYLVIFVIVKRFQLLMLLQSIQHLIYPYLMLFMYQHSTSISYLLASWVIKLTSVFSFNLIFVSPRTWTAGRWLDLLGKARDYFLDLQYSCINSFSSAANARNVSAVVDSEIWPCSWIRA